MGGSGPTIDGGMTEEQYKKLQLDERKWMAEQEDKQMARMEEMEDKRAQREEAELQRQERVRDRETQALEAMENKLSSNIESIADAEDDEDQDIAIDFYSSLAKSGKKNNSSGSRPV